jgi:hypothetical protein
MPPLERLRGPNHVERTQDGLGSLRHSIHSGADHPQSDIMPHIRQLDICIQTNDPDTVDRLRLVIGALPRDKLQTFSADDHIDTLTFQLLLQSQRKLKSICIKTEFTTLG